MAKKIKRPPMILYLLLVGLANIYTKLTKGHHYYGKRHLRSLPQGPLVVVGNHTNFFDFLYMARTLYPRRINFVVAAKYFRFKELSFILRLAQAIPKNLYSPDIRTVSRATSIINQGGVVGIYPEGQISLGGITLPLPEGIGKLVKHLGVPVAAVRSFGGGFVDPPWSKRHRKGIVESHFHLVLSKDQVRSMAPEAIDSVLKEALFANPYEWQRKSGLQYTGNEITDGLTHILYICPNCLSEFTLHTFDDKIACTQCGLEASMTGSGHFHWPEGTSYFDHIGTWYQWQYQQEEATITGNEDYILVLPVRLAMYKKKGLGIEEVGEGTMTISREEYLYQGSVRGEKSTLHFPTKNIRYVPFAGGRNFQIYDNDQLHEFRPNPGIHSVKASLVGETIYLLQKKKS